MTTAAYEVKRGSLVVVTGDIEQAQAIELHKELHKACGHDRFVILTVPPSGDAAVYGPDDLEAKMREALLR